MYAEDIEEQVIDDSVEGEVIRVTASMGISSVRLGVEDLQTLIEAADAAMYESKRSGRNRVTTWSADVAQENSIDGNHHGIDIATGLRNRAGFRKGLAEQIRQVEESGQYAAVLLLDLDMFKRINNIFGHSGGDAVLVAVAERLNTTIRDTDSAVRLDGSELGQEIFGLGGDEFGILLTGLEAKDDVSIVVERLTSSLALPVMVNDQEVFMTCSIGVSQFPDDGADADTLIICASVALQQAKREGKNKCQYFRNDFVSTVRNDYEIEKAIRFALDNDEFELYYQPQLDVQSLRIHSVEALIRWNHPQRGFISPGEFIPAAEATGLIVNLGEWVIKEACQQIRSWLDAGLELPVAINLSPVQFRQPGLAEQITTAVSTARIDPQHLHLEITEGVIMEELDSALETLTALSRLGYKISVDDFGTGYSSLEYLKRFPVDILKIDRAFIKEVEKDADDAAIVRATISMAHGMDLKVVAEGVENEEQLLFLRNLHCDMVQGFLLGRPLPAKDIVALIDEKQWQAQA